MYKSGMLRLSSFSYHVMLRLSVDIVTVIIAQNKTDNNGVDTRIYASTMVSKGNTLLSL